MAYQLRERGGVRVHRGPTWSGGAGIPVLLCVHVEEAGVEGERERESGGDGRKRRETRGKRKRGR